MSHPLSLSKTYFQKIKEKSMSENRLNIVSVDNKEPPQQGNKGLTKTALKLEAQATCERLWRENPDQFNPLSNCMDRMRLDRTYNLITPFVDLHGKTVAELGCGSGTFTRRLRDSGAAVHAVDIAGNALKALHQHDDSNIQTFQDYVPMTSLKDNAYDLVVATDIIAYLHPNEYRLFFAELSRLVKPEGYAVCSTPVDINSDDALQRFGALAETEFIIAVWVFSYHSFYIRVCDFFLAPARFVKGNSDATYRQKEIEKRYALNRWWYSINSTAIPAAIWKIVSYLSNPLAAWLKQSTAVMNMLEKVCKFISSDNGISHATFIGKRRPLMQMPPADAMPQEMKHKKQLWE